ncbi:desmethylxanthohumol 6'-O-methyltransferase-like isoform X2 [Tripterygium wilfordii]|uniref:desmethylxanthohumol 6'-O-methyltransferase-like isoform X2 n=1 Tax=Tripterygium wilfordii TaxID=458696 RepID=UPI0018F85EDD|nr:desmethylxanthohumol 6'-O-methyltransferase-like isoform X2 [Tripterygium wilfordii]
MASVEGERLLEGQTRVWKLMFGFVDSLTLKCAVELRIADIINSHGGPISLSQIASGIDSPHPDLSHLVRIMRYLVRKQVFSAHQPEPHGETLYGLTDTSKWLLTDSDLSLNPMVILQNNPFQLAPWHCLGQCVREGGIAYEKAHGCEMWDFASQNPEFNRMFNDAMAYTAQIFVKALVSDYKDGFDGVETLVDVAGGIGRVLGEIVKAYPHIKGINLDLGHVIATAPEYPGITHVIGDMFKSIPKADAVLMQRIMHDWEDEECVKILKNCRKAIAQAHRTGKLIMVEIILPPNGGSSSSSSFGDVDLAYDLLMFSHMSGGKERTEAEFKKLLEGGGFPRHKIIQIPALLSVIEAYPE